ncbi:UNVERIFIED_CONTAM: hypothetical protein FKN15_039941 [Acipenser sinensis]
MGEYQLEGMKRHIPRVSDDSADSWENSGKLKGSRNQARVQGQVESVNNGGSKIRSTDGQDSQNLGPDPVRSASVNGALHSMSQNGGGQWNEKGCGKRTSYCRTNVIEKSTPLLAVYISSRCLATDNDTTACAQWDMEYHSLQLSFHGSSMTWPKHVQTT